MKGRKQFASGLFQSLFMTCEEATFIISKEDVTVTPWLKKLHLRVHLLTCNYCTKFRKQIKLINTLLHSKKSNQNISPEFKQNLKQSMASLLKKRDAPE